jgi:thiamine transporter
MSLILSDQLQYFFESTKGQIATVIIILILFTLILISGKSKKVDTKALVISGVFIALYVALNQIIIFRMPQGGSITAFSMLAIALCGYLLGPRRAIMAGMCAGLIELIFNPYVIHPLQLLLDYPLAVGALGFAGLLRDKKIGLIGGYSFGVLCRYTCSFLSGVIFFGEYAPQGFNSFTWSLFYNLSYIGTEAALTFAILMFPQVRNTFKRLKTQIDKE